MKTLWIVVLLGLLFLPLTAYGETHVLVFAGSTRQGSYNMALAKEAAAEVAESGQRVTYIDLKEYPMPLFNEDLERNQGMPAGARAFRQKMIENDVIIIASPEYNASVTPLLKNSLDWASRNPSGGYSNEAFKGKRFILLSASPGRGGGASGLNHLRTILEVLGGKVSEEQLSVSQAHEAIGKDPEYQASLKKLVSAL